MVGIHMLRKDNCDRVSVRRLTACGLGRELQDRWKWRNFEEFWETIGQPLRNGENGRNTFAEYIFTLSNRRRLYSLRDELNRVLVV